MNFKTDSSWIASHLFSFALLVCFAVILSKKPAYNSDIIPYMALVLRMQDSNKTEVHHKIYDNLKHRLPPLKYDLLIGAEDYRKAAIYRDPNLLLNLLPHHAVKPLYVHLVRWIHRLGVDLVMATLIPSFIFFIVMGMFFFSWLYSLIQIRSAVGLLAIIMGTPIIVNTARLSSPDMMASAFFFIALFMILSKKRTRWSFLLMILSVATRIDFLIPSVICINYLALRKAIPQKDYMVGMVIFTAIYFYITSYSSAYGWGNLFFDQYASFYRLENETSTNKIIGYLKLLHRQLIRGWNGSTWVILLIALLTLLLRPALKMFKETTDHQWVILSLIIMLTRTFLHPEISDRFFISYFLLIIILLVCKIAHYDSLDR